VILPIGPAEPSREVIVRSRCIFFHVDPFVVDIDRALAFDFRGFVHAPRQTTVRIGATGQQHSQQEQNDAASPD
jgi:hypothetical protein